MIEKLKKLIESGKLTYSNIASVAGVSEMTVRNWLKGIGEPRLSQSEKLQVLLK